VVDTAVLVVVRPDTVEEGTEAPREAGIRLRAEDMQVEDMVSKADSSRAASSRAVATAVATISVSDVGLWKVTLY
jgi:hypothetical protein